MIKYIMDCNKVESEIDFWKLYLLVVNPEGAEYFGRNLEAFWDALSAGGPGFPGESECTIKVINTASLKRFENEKFYEQLKKISHDLKADPASKIIFKVE